MFNTITGDFSPDDTLTRRKPEPGKCGVSYPSIEMSDQLASRTRICLTYSKNIGLARGKRFYNHFVL